MMTKMVEIVVRIMIGIAMKKLNCRVDFMEKQMLVTLIRNQMKQTELPQKMLTRQIGTKLKFEQERWGRRLFA